MGWLFIRGASKEQVLRELTEDVVAQQLCGEVLWVVIEFEAENRIGCFLLQDGGCDGWGYKEMEESMHPHQYSCPLTFLELAPVACRGWRSKVFEYHAQRMT